MMRTATPFGILEIWNRATKLWAEILILATLFSAVFVAPMLMATADPRAEAQVRFTTPVFDREFYVIDASQYARVAVQSYLAVVDSSAFQDALLASTSVEGAADDLKAVITGSDSEDGAALRVTVTWPDATEARLLADGAVELIASDALNIIPRFSDGRDIVEPVVIRPAALLPEQGGVSLKAIAAAIVGGFLLALLIALSRSMLSNRVRYVEDLQRALPPFPHLRITETSRQASQRPNAIRALRGRIAADGIGQLVVMTSANAGAQVETLGEELVRSFEAAEQKAIKVSFLEQNDAAGGLTLSTLLADDEGTRPEAASGSAEDVAASPRTSRAIDRLLASHDYVIITCPSISDSSITGTLLPRSRSVMLVVDLHADRAGPVRTAGDLLAEHSLRRVEVLALHDR